MTGRAGPAADVAAVLGALIAAQSVQAERLTREVDCTASHLSHILHRHVRPSPTLAARLDAALGSGGQVAAALVRTPVTRPRRSGPRPSRSPR